MDIADWTQARVNDVEIVDWDGPRDTENPYVKHGNGQASIVDAW